MSGAKNPKRLNKTCYGFDIRQAESIREGFDLEYLLLARDLIGEKEFINNKRFFCLLAGTDELYHQLILGASEEDIRESWEPKLTEYKKMRVQYLLY
jgi:hypothetical protein